jgi:hypothetical protein
METFKGLGYPQVEDPINGAGIGPFITPGSVDPVTHTTEVILEWPIWVRVFRLDPT